jgi:hypothetical protein
VALGLELPLPDVAPDEVPPAAVPPVDELAFGEPLLPHAANITARAARMTKEQRPLRLVGFMVSPLVLAAGHPALSGNLDLIGNLDLMGIWI